MIKFCQIQLLSVSTVMQRFDVETLSKLIKAYNCEIVYTSTQFACWNVLRSVMSGWFVYSFHFEIWAVPLKNLFQAGAQNNLHSSLSVLCPRWSQMEDRISFGLALPLCNKLLLSDPLEKVDSINVKLDFTPPPRPLPGMARPRSSPGSQIDPYQWQGSTAIWFATTRLCQCLVYPMHWQRTDAVSCQPAERGWGGENKVKVNIRLTTQKKSVYPFQNR